VPQNPSAAEKTRHDCSKSVPGDEQRGDMHRMTPHPCYRLVVIGGRDPEHASINQRPSRAQAMSFSAAPGMNEENLLGEATEAEKMTIRSSAFA
jgi:hypothetical protein